MDSCVSIDQLERLLDEQLEHREGEALANHVERCPDCQQRLEGLMVPRGAAADSRGPESLPPGAGAGFLRGLKRRGPPGRDDDTISPLRARPDFEAKNEQLADPDRLPTIRGFRIVREVGRGGMGVVYEAEQKSLGRRVALKVLAAGSLPDANQVRRFERGAKAAARLHHTNIVPVFGVGCRDGRHYFVMQFIVGSGLDAVLDDLRRSRWARSEGRPAAVPAPRAGRAAGPTAGEVASSFVTGRFAGDGPIPPGRIVTDAIVGEPAAAPPPLSSAADSPSIVLPDTSEVSASDLDRRYYRSVARIGIQVAEALADAHGQGILHRDVKPSNLLLDECGKVWVADFGLAKSSEADDLTHTGDILGTVRYMAPERFSGQCDARSDLYSLGLTLYELVALRPAFEAPDRHALIERVLHEEPQRLKKLAPAVPRDLETIIAKASARDPAGRYATATALAEDLKRFVEDRPIRARRVSAAERLVRWCRRNPWIAGSMGVAAAALMAALVVSLLYAERQARHATDLADANTQIRTALSESNRRLAMFELECGRIAFEKSQIGVGMLRTVEALRTAAVADDPAWKRTVLANLSAWRRELPELKGIFPHENIIPSAAFSPDGRTIVTGSYDKTARLWEADTARPVGQPMVHSAPVTDVAFSPDGKIVLTGTEDKTARLWDAATGRPLGQPLPHPMGVTSVAFSPDGKILLTGCADGTVRQWDAATGRSTGPLIIHEDAVDAVAFSPDGRSILTAGWPTAARLWDADTGRQIGQSMEHRDRVLGVAFSPDGKILVTGCLDGRVRQWNADTGRPTGPLITHEHAVDAVAFSPDGQSILTGCRDRTAQLWDAATGERLGPPLEHPGAVYAVAFSPDGRSILTGGDDNTVRRWTVEPGQPAGRFLSNGAPAFSPDGKAILVRDNSGKVMLWDIASGQPTGRPMKLEPGVLHAAWSPDGRTILTGSVNRTARLWDTASGQPIGPALAHPGMVYYVAFGPDGRTILTAGPDPEARLWAARLWDTTTGRPIGQPMPHAGRIDSWAFSPDGRTLLTACHDRAALRWDATNGQPLGPPLRHPRSVWKVAFSPDGRSILTLCSDPLVRRWDGATGQAIEPPLWHPDRVSCLAFSPDGRTILTGCHDERVRLWDADTGRQIGQTMEHPDAVRSVAFSPDGKILVTGCGDARVRLWDADTNRQIGQTMEHPYNLSGVAFSPDGRLLLMWGFGTALQLWDVPAPLPDDGPRLTAWVEAATGLELDERDSVRVLDRDAWQERRRRLEQLGGLPLDHANRLDPVLSGEQPAARGDAFAERGLWDQAEAAYLEAVRARPLDARWTTNSAWTALTRFYIARGRSERAVAELGAAVSRWPDVLELRFWHCVALLSAGDWVGWERAIAGLLDRFPGPMHPRWAHADVVAFASALGPDRLAHPEVPLRLAEAAIRNAAEDPFESKFYFRWLGWALYRAGRYDEAIRRLQEAFAQGRGGPADFAFLSMAHHRLGHREEALGSLDRLRKYQPVSAPDRFWYDHAIRLLRSEAEAVILYDPVFPDDPFAR
jgi:WD40 repeat protein/serine/threonine protein kinase